MTRIPGLFSPFYIVFTPVSGLDALVRDLRFAFRLMRRQPISTLAIILLLALGTGGVTTVFNPIYSTLFIPLPFPQPEKLVIIGGDIPLFNASFQRFEKEEELARLFSNLTTYAPFPASMALIPDTGRSKEIYSVDVSKDFLETLAVPPLRGYDFKHNEGRPSAVVSNRFWFNELMQTEDAIGKLIQVHGLTYTIIGIMPKTFDFPAGADIWTYRGLAEGTLTSSARQYIGRLRPGISMGQAAEELISLDFKPGSSLLGNGGPILQTLKSVLYGDRRPMLWTLGSVAVLFLLLMCAGAMNLLVTQGTRRKSEMAMRLILGISRRGLIFQLLIETVPLVVIGAFAGFWLSKIAGAWLPAQFPALKGSEAVVPVKISFFVALVFAMTILSGLTPALYASGVDLNTYLKSGSNFKRRFFSFSLQELLTGVQLGLALALLTGIGLLISGLMFNVYVPIRWLSRNTMAVVRAELPMSANQSMVAFKEGMIRNAIFFQNFQHSLNAMPEVAAAGIIYPIPLSTTAVQASQRRTAVAKLPPSEIDRGFLGTIEGYVSPDGFGLLGIPLIAGRYFSSADMSNEIDYNIEYWSEGKARIDGGVVIVNQSLARQFWPGENAIGKTIYNRSVSYEVIGIVRDFHHVGDNNNFIPAVYYPPDSTSVQNSLYEIRYVKT